MRAVAACMPSPLTLVVAAVVVLLMRPPRRTTAWRTLRQDVRHAWAHIDATAPPPVRPAARPERPPPASTGGPVPAPARRGAGGQEPGGRRLQPAASWPRPRRPGSTAGLRDLLAAPSPALADHARRTPGSRAEPCSAAHADDRPRRPAVQRRRPRLQRRPCAASPTTWPPAVFGFKPQPTVRRARRTPREGRPALVGPAAIRSAGCAAPRSSPTAPATPTRCRPPLAGRNPVRIPAGSTGKRPARFR